MTVSQHGLNNTTPLSRNRTGRDPGPGRGWKSQDSGRPDFFSDYDQLFRKSSLHLLLTLGRNFSSTFPVRVLARTLEYDVSIISKNLRYLEERALVTHERMGNLVLYRANMDNVLLRQMKVFFTLLELNDLIRALSPLSSNLILFGSCATADDTETSDIDLFVETMDTAEARSVIQTCQERVARTISPILVAPDELYVMKAQDPALYSSIHQGIVVQGADHVL
jgi:predicted nucleotidyltransferase